MADMKIRLAEQKDKPSMLAISEKIWDGSDYIPNVVDYWLSGVGGKTLVITLDEVVKGFARLTTLSAKHGWLEGIRVDESARGLGLGKALTDAMIALAKSEGYSHIELSSFIENYESLAIVKRKGFEEKAAFKYYERQVGEDLNLLPLYEAQLSGFCIRPVKLSTETQEGRIEFEALHERIIQSPGLRDRSGYWSYDWTFSAYAPEALAVLLEAGGLYEVIDASQTGEKVLGLFALSKRYAKGDYETLHWTENETVLQTAVIWTLCQNAKAGVMTSLMLPAKALDQAEQLGLVGLSEASEDAFVFEYKER